MKFLDRITGNDMTRQWKSLDMRASKLPKDYQQAYAQITAELWQRTGVSGRDILAMLDGVLELLEDGSAGNRTAQDVLGDDIKGFCRFAGIVIKSFIKIAQPEEYNRFRIILFDFQVLLS